MKLCNKNFSSAIQTAAIVPRSKNLVMRHLRCTEEEKYSDWEEQGVSWQRKKMRGCGGRAGATAPLDSPRE